MSRYYLVHGLIVESDLELLDLSGAEKAIADVSITIGQEIAEDESLEDLFALEEARFLVPGVASFDIRNGQSIDIRPASGADWRDIRIFALGSAMGILLHQRGLFALHAAAGIFHDRAIAITGPSGQGKSTFALAMECMGVRLLADDLLAISTDGMGVEARRAVRRIRVCEDAMAAHNLDPAAFPYSYGRDDERTKHDIPIRDAPVVAPLVAVVELAEGPLSLDRLQGAEAVDCLMANSFRGTMLTVGTQRNRHFQSSIAIAQRVPVYRLSRQHDLSGLPAQIDLIAALAGDIR